MVCASIYFAFAAATFVIHIIRHLILHMWLTSLLILHLALYLVYHHLAKHLIEHMKGLHMPKKHRHAENVARQQHVYSLYILNKKSSIKSMCLQYVKSQEVTSRNHSVVFSTVLFPYTPSSVMDSPYGALHFNRFIVRHANVLWSLCSTVDMVWAPS